MNIIRNILTRNTFRPVWWGTFETVSEFGGFPNIAKAISDAEHNINIAAVLYSKVSYDDLEALREAHDQYEQAKYNRAILDNIYDDTIQY